MRADRLLPAGLQDWLCSPVVILKSALNHSLVLESSVSSIFLLFSQASGRELWRALRKRGCCTGTERKEFLHLQGPSQNGEKMFTCSFISCDRVLVSCPSPATDVPSLPVLYFVGCKIRGRPLPALGFSSKSHLGADPSSASSMALTL